MVQDTTFVELRFFHSGYCTAPAFIVDPEKGKGKSKFYAVWALIKHPSHGYLIFDTGYTKKFYEATKKFPQKLYALATPVSIEKGQSALEQLAGLSIQPSQINYVILSHFHADHIAGAIDFPHAKFICSKTALEEVRNKEGFAALRKGILKELLPPDFESRAQCIEQLSTGIADPDAGLLFYDLFKDKSVELVALPGHARGMLGIKVKSTTGEVLLATDASWSKDTFLRQVLPSKISKLFFDSWDDYCLTFKKLFHYYKKNPAVTILFTHCPETLKYIASQKNV